MNKKAYQKTMEAVIAVIILMIFIHQVVPRGLPDEAGVPSDIELLQDTIFNGIKTNETLRSYALNGEVEKLNEYVGYISRNITYSNITITNLDGNLGRVSIAENKTVYAKSMIVGANLNIYSPKLLMLYLWRKI